MAHKEYRIFVDGAKKVKKVYKPMMNREDIIFSFVEAREFEDFKRMIEVLGIPQFISFGDALGDGKNTMDCAKFLVQWCEEHDELIPRFLVHSTSEKTKSDIKYFLEFHTQRLIEAIEPPVKKDSQAGKNTRSNTGFSSIDITEVEEIFMLGDNLQEDGGEDTIEEDGEIGE